MPIFQKRTDNSKKKTCQAFKTLHFNSFMHKDLRNV